MPHDSDGRAVAGGKHRTYLIGMHVKGEGKGVRWASRKSEVRGRSLTSGFGVSHVLRILGSR